MATSSNLTITKTGLTKTACELINKRQYAPSKVILTGHPLVTVDGALSALTKEAYASSEKFSFPGAASEVKIKFAGIFRKNGLANQTCFCLHNFINTDKNLLLYADGNKLYCYSGTTLLFRINEFTLTDSDEVQIELDFNDDRYSLAATINKKRKEISGLLPVTLDFTNYDSVIFGNNPENLTKFWCGTVFLTKFFLIEGEDAVYTPSISPNFKFTHVLVSDGSVDLTNTSGTVYKHVYEFPIDEYPIGRDGNYILLKATVNGTVSLNINQIGIYASTESESFLYGIIKGLSLQKKKDLGYDLIFKLNMTVGVVNTQIYPEITIKDEKYTNYNNLATLEKVHADTVVDMERAITNNAMLLGYEPDAVFYQLFNESRFAGNNYSSVRQYASITKNVHSSYTRTYDANRVVVVGNPKIEDSVFSGFSETDYAYIPTTMVLLDNWEIEFSFQCKEAGVCTLYSFCDDEGHLLMNFYTTLTELCMYMGVGTPFHKRIMSLPGFNKVYVKVTFDGYNLRYYTRSENTEYIYLGNTSSTRIIGGVARCYAGLLGGSSVVFPEVFTGNLDLGDLILYSNSTNYGPARLIPKNLEPQDFYSFIDYPASSYKIKNLKVLTNSDIDYFEGSITGHHDSIDFSGKDGGSLTIKTNISNGNDKVLLAKVNLNTNDEYFTLKFENFSLIFTLYMSDGVVELKKEYTETSYNELIGAPIIITVISDNSSGTPIFSMYLNTEKVNEVAYPTQNYLLSSAYKLTNYENSITEADKNYVSTIVSFKGNLTKDDVRYVCTILGTSV